MFEDMFRDHVAKLTDLGNIRILEFKKPGSSYNYVRFIFDEDVYTLYITGDLGDLIAHNKSNMTFEKFKQFVASPSYFEQKVLCHSRKLCYYDEDKAYSDLKEYIEKNEIDCSDYTIEDILTDFSRDRGISEYGMDILEHLDSDCWEWCENIGKKKTEVINMYLTAFDLAVKQLEGGKEL